MVVTVEQAPAMKAAREAVAWGKAPSKVDPAVNNYTALYLDVLRVVRTTDAGQAVVHQLPGLAMAHWPCLSRMLIMDNPGLADRIHPHLDPTLDSQAGTTWLQLQFAEVTGRRPLVRSWRHVKASMPR